MIPDGTIGYVEIDGKLYKGHMEKDEFIQDEDEPTEPPIKEDSNESMGN